MYLSSSSKKSHKRQTGDSGRGHEGAWVTNDGNLDSCIIYEYKKVKDNNNT